jgi:hypothetical protein
MILYFYFKSIQGLLMDTSWYKELGFHRAVSVEVRLSEIYGKF